MRLLLVRHGQSPSNVAHLLDTQVPGPALTDVGREQAQALVGLLGDEGIGLVTSSPQTRARQTAAPLAAALGLDVEVVEGLEEIAAGELEMRGDEPAVRAYLGVVGSWLTGDLDVPMPGAADGNAFFARYDAAVERVVARARELGAGVAVATSHGAAIRCWTGVRVRNLSAEYVVATGLLNTGCVALEGEPETGWTATSWMGAALDPERAEAAGAGPAGEPATPSVF
ncbi:histidine phosphatase family protein [Kineococcus sp. SYSU DK004]|uniref:histidine phosphatase family protein n=1 Tax=Kineococcus sp. SYSU DK004 TaxID=3383125 RepID=UPI003D7E1BE8